MSDDIWLRKNEVDILNYLPNPLRKDPRFYASNTAESKEHEQIRLILNDLLDQLFIDTATWGLSLFERFLGIYPRDDDDYETRRTRIKIILNTHGVSTVEFMTDLANKFLSDNSAQIIEHNDEYWFEVCVNIDGIISDGDLRDAIELFKPAHLGFKMVFYIISDVSIDHEADIIQYINSEHNFWNIGSGIVPHWDGKFIWDGEIDWSGHIGEDYKERQTFVVEIAAKINSVETFDIEHKANILFKVNSQHILPTKHENEIMQHEDAKHIFWNIGTAKYTHLDGEYDCSGEIDWSGVKGDDKYRTRQPIIVDVTAETDSIEPFNIDYKAEMMSSRSPVQNIPITHDDSFIYSVESEHSFTNSVLAYIARMISPIEPFNIDYEAEAMSSHSPVQNIQTKHENEIMQHEDAKHIFWNIGTAKYTHLDGEYDCSGEIDWSGVKGDDKYRTRLKNLCTFYYIDQNKNTIEGSYENL